ncbi:hypothetical protein DHW03_19090 [Pedobacter yonginense]|uniref:Uncharacterized protein n=1 Tax=Pedobacter yonginense TaxID=651869 RepID=A0A317EGK0_9SPHI|nr:hypothetical protein [Pedobacter yonginense]PWS25940.1 hypothetical protein DHW03_19090 [Pedobacter yonginense]
MDLQKYVIEIKDFGKFEVESNNIFFALDEIKEKQTNARVKDLIILSAFVIINNDFLIDITSSLNGN